MKKLLVKAAAIAALAAALGGCMHTASFDNSGGAYWVAMPTDYEANPGGLTRYPK